MTLCSSEHWHPLFHWQICQAVTASACPALHRPKVSWTSLLFQVNRRHTHRHFPNGNARSATPNDIRECHRISDLTGEDWTQSNSTLAFHQKHCAIHKILCNGPLRNTTQDGLSEFFPGLHARLGSLTDSGVFGFSFLLPYRGLPLLLYTAKPPHLWTHNHFAVNFQISWEETKYLGCTSSCSCP